jgi:putative chitinase
MTKEQLAACTGCKPETAAPWLADLSDAMGCYGIATPKRQAAFLAQVGTETGLRVKEENLNYSAERLMKVFPRYFVSMDVASLYAGKPEKIGSRVYGTRMGNGDEASGEGYRYRGRGLIQLTGKENYTACGKALGLDLVGKPELLKEQRFAAMSAAWFWEWKKLNEAADFDDFGLTCYLVNGGPKDWRDKLALGQMDWWDERFRLWGEAKKALGVA